MISTMSLKRKLYIRTASILFLGALSLAAVLFYPLAGPLQFVSDGVVVTTAAGLALLVAVNITLSFSTASNLRSLEQATNMSQRFYSDETAFTNSRQDAPMDTENEIDNALRSFEAVVKKLRYKAFYDILTGCPNSSFYYERLTQTIRLSKRYGYNSAVLLIDLDGLKQINKSFGKDAGDKILVESASRIKMRVRDSDMAARLEGSTFTVILAKINNFDEAGMIADSIIHLFGIPFKLDGSDVYLDINIGVACIPTDDITVKGIMHKAGAAMYAAKLKGKRCYSYPPSELGGEAQEKNALVEKLRNAITNNEFVLYYQPQVDAKKSTRCMIGMEALLRWNDPESGLVQPNDFIPLAEETGLIVTLGNWVLHEACKTIKLFEHTSHPIYVSVNVSPLQLKQPDFIFTVRSAIEQEGICPGNLHLEITESIFIREYSSIETLHELNKLGVKIGLDDFGTGYSSLSMLNTLPVHYLKIDRSFVRDLEDNTKKNIIAVILLIAKTLEMNTICEGVETQAQLGCLLKEGASHFQGFLFGHPQPLSVLVSKTQIFTPLQITS